MFYRFKCLSHFEKLHFPYIFHLSCSHLLLAIQMVDDSISYARVSERAHSVVPTCAIIWYRRGRRFTLQCVWITSIFLSFVFFGVCSILRALPGWNKLRFGSWLIDACLLVVVAVINIYMSTVMISCPLSRECAFQ